jgi:hypothetical protein
MTLFGGTISLFTLHRTPRDVRCKTRSRVVRYTFLVRLFHHLLYAGLQCRSQCSSERFRNPNCHVLALHSRTHPTAVCDRTTTFALPVSRRMCVCPLSHDRMLKAYTQMQNTFAGMKPNCDVRNPITQTIKLLTIETRSPVQDFRPTRIVASTVSRQER